MKKRSLLLVSALLTAVLVLPAMAGPLLGVVEIRGIDNLGNAVFELSQAAGQPTPKEMVTMGIRGVLGSPAGVGLEPNGTVRMLWLDDGTTPGTFAALLPVTGDGADYLAALGQAGWTTEGEIGEGLMHLKAPQGQFSPFPEAYFQQADGAMIAAQSAEAVRSAAATLADLPAILPAEGVIAYQILPAALMAKYEPQMTASMEEAFADMPTGEDPEADQAAAIARLYAQGYVAVAKQIQEYVLGLGVGDGNLNLHQRIAAVPGTTLAKWLDSIGTPSADAAVVNLPGALFVETAHLGDLSLLADPYFHYVEQVMKLVPADFPAEEFEAYMTDARACWEQMSGDFGLAVLPPAEGAPLRLVEYVAIENPALLREITTRMMASAQDMVNAMMAAQPNQPVRIELAMGDPREYRDIAIDRITYRVTPGAEVESDWPFDGPIELTGELAWLPGGIAAAVGGEALTETLVDRALDGSSAPVSSLSSWQAFYPDPEDNLLDLTHIAVFDGLRSFLGLMEEYTGESEADAIPAGPGNLDSLTYRAAGGIMTRLRFSLDDIGAVARKMQEAQQKAAAERQAQMEALQQEMMEAEMSFEDMDDESFDDWAEDEDWEADDDMEMEMEEDIEIEVPAPQEPEPAQPVLE